MKGVVYAGPGKVAVEDVPEPRIQEPTDALVEVKRTAICGSDLHLLDGKTPGMREGCVIGHEFVGLIAELGDGVLKHHEGVRALGSFLIACGSCEPCRRRRFNFCKERRALGLGALVGDLEGAQAEFVRVPNADINLRRLDGGMAGLSDEEALFGGDILATGFYGAAISEIQKDDVVVVVGGGPIGFFCALAARRYEPSKVLVLDMDESRLGFLRQQGIDAHDVSEAAGDAVVAGATEGRMADVAIEAVGAIDALKSAMRSVRDGGRVTIVGVYGTERYELPTGTVWVRGLDLRWSGMANVHAHWDEALLAVAKGDVEPTAIITHRLPLDEAPEGYELFRTRKAMKVVLTP